MITTIYRVQVFFEYPNIKDIARFTKASTKIDDAMDQFLYMKDTNTQYTPPGPCYGACLTMEVENYVQAEMLQEKIVAVLKEVKAVKIQVN